MIAEVEDAELGEKEFPRDFVLYAEGKYRLTFHGHQVEADTLEEVEALWMSAKKYGASP